MMIIRLKATLAFFCFFIIGLLVFYFSAKELIDYYRFYDEIIYSWLDFFAFLFSFVILLFSVYPGCVTFYGVPMSAEKSKSIYKIALIIFVMSLITPGIFSFVYVDKIESKGYIKCQGMPSGWMPGMATKYVINEKLCLKKDP